MSQRGNYSAKGHGTLQEECWGHLVFGSGDGFGEGEEGQRQVHEAVLVGLDLPVTLNHLQQLQAHQADHGRRRRGDGRDDLARDQLAL